MMKVQKRFLISALTVSGMFSGANVLGQEEAAQRSTLDRVRDAGLDTFTLEVEVERRAKPFLPGQGRAIRLLRVTVGKEVTAMVWKVTQLPSPKYFPPGTEGYSSADFDSNGNLLLPMASEGALIHDAETNDDYVEDTAFLVAPDGSATQTGPHPSLFRHHPSSMNTESLGLLGRALWALGRPWGNGFGDLISDEEMPDGLHKLRTTTSGWSFKSARDFERACELVIAPGDGFLVRHADLGRDAKCHSEGTRWFGNVAWAERGEFVLGGAETVTVRLVSFSPTFDPDLVAEGRKIVARARSQRVQVMDFRIDDPTKRLRTVPAGELDKEK